ncbi:MAG: hypothetical protein ACREA9_03630 [Pyrinomonadaceae bacterium]
MINRHKLGLLVGVFSGACHFFWALLVLAGIAQSLMDWIFRLHLIQPLYTILPFSLGYAATLVLFTAFGGYLSGWVLAALWNWLQGERLATATIPLPDSRRHATGH